MKTERYIIENSFIKKELTIEKNRIKSFSYFNKVSERSLTALEGSEVFLLSFGKGFFKKKIKASDLKIKGTTERIESASKRHELLFEPFRVKDSTISLTLVYETGDNDFFLRKHLEFEIIKQGAKDVILDCIDFENLSFNEGLSYWTVPKQEKSHIPGFALGLGQPVYVDSMFFGFEFPVCLTEIKENTTSVKYYNGRTLKKLCGGKSFNTESFVAGCGDGNLKEQVQKAFFSYIKTISKPVRLRRQYNSWYDHMLNITRENVTSSFLENEKGLTFSGEPALDSYVADDGWNDYDKDFWSFNEKFPDELYPFSKLSEALVPISVCGLVLVAVTQTTHQSLQRELKNQATATITSRLTISVLQAQNITRKQQSLCLTLKSASALITGSLTALHSSLAKAKSTTIWWAAIRICISITTAGRSGLTPLTDCRKTALITSGLTLPAMRGPHPGSFVMSTVCGCRYVTLKALSAKKTRSAIRTECFLTVMRNTMISIM